MLDSLGMFTTLLDSSNQIKAGKEIAKDALVKHKKFDVGNIENAENIVVAGMGGSGLIGDLISAVGAFDIELPIHILKSSSLPAFVSQKTLFLAVSFSGNTAETLIATEEAKNRGASIVSISTGGRLKELSKNQGFLSIEINPEVSSPIPMPRAGFFQMAAAALTFLTEVNLYKNNHLEKAVPHISKRVEELATERSSAYNLAKDLGGTIPLISAASGIGAVAARRLKNQINENSKTPAFFSEVPEAFHNELVGWGVQGDVTRQVFSLVTLRSDFEPSGFNLDKAIEVATEMQEEVVSNCFKVSAEGSTALCQLFDLVVFGDFVSLYLADLLGVDPGPIPAVDELKSRI